VKLLPLTLFLCAVAAAQDSYYAGPGLFSTRPSESKSLQTIDRFGPVGISVELHQPAFVMKVGKVEPGSPSDGVLAPGQVIESINGQALADIDPRIQLGRILAEAEATDGRLVFAIAGEAAPAVVEVPVLGAYSPTWPLDCPKSERIVRGVAEYLKRPGATEGLGGIGMLFLLSTGEDDDLEFVRAWAHEAPAHSYPWYLGYGGIPLTECYLRTGDPEILANIQRWVDNAAKSQHNDAWAGRGSALTGYGLGHLNASGTHVLTFLLLAKECGADVPHDTLHGALRHFFRYAGRGNNPYGDDRPYSSFVDNGKCGKLAFAMAAAAALTQDEGSVYARARDVCAMQSFYTTTFMLHGHTGGGIGEIWRSAAMGLLAGEKPAQYRDFMDSRRWHYDLSRRFDGSFGILGGGGYDKELWGIAYPLSYTIPRRTLRITGAPPTEHSKRSRLPAQPWGTAADDAFLSLVGVLDAAGEAPDVSGETLAEDSSLHLLQRLQGTPTDDELRWYLRHPDHNIRDRAAAKIVGQDSNYLGRRSGGGAPREGLMMEGLRHEDPRVRRAMFAALLGRGDLVTPEVFDLAVAAVRDPDESWFLKDAAIQLIGRGSTEQLVPLVDLLLPYIEHEEAWLRNAALTALSPVAADERCYERVLPAMGELVRTNQRVSVTHGFAPAIRARIKAAGPAVQALATATLKEVFTGYAGLRTSPAGQDLRPTYDYHLDAIAASLADVPGGLDVLYELAREQQPDEILPYKQIFLAADPSSFGPALKRALVPIITEELVPEFVGRNRKRLRPLAAGEVQSGRPGGRGEPVDELAALYRRAGHDAYDWRMFVDLREAEWAYHSFDPLPEEQVPFDQLITRYREVSLPAGMEDWAAPDFEPETAGWARGRSPFGNANGALPTRPITKCGAGCIGPGCYGATPVNTLWEKEVLLLRGTFELPPLKDGHRYRLRVNSGEHVGAGGGHAIYVNGRLLVEQTQGNGRGSGGLPIGGYITEEFRDEFASGEVTIAVKTFIRFNDKYKVHPTSRTPQGKISLHLDEQRLPPMGDELVALSARVVPMRSGVWQAALVPEDAAQDPDEHLFRWDGELVANPDLHGTWEVVGQVPTLVELDPSRKPSPARGAPFSELTLLDGGATTAPTWAWSGDVLMDLDRYQALRMELVPLDGTEYLLVEAGGFDARRGPDWRPQLLVLTRK